jgi:hypothetical protein
LDNLSASHLKLVRPASKGKVHLKGCICALSSF